MPNDTYFSIGSTHRVCQDFALHNNEGIIISDGCSSAKESDTGARLLTHSTLKYSDHDWHDILSYAANAANSIGLDRDSLCATLLRARLKDNEVIVDMIGDGVIVSRKNINGELEIFNLEFESSAPFYLRYHMDNMKDDYIQRFGDRYKINGQPQARGFFEDYPDGVIRKSFDTQAYEMVVLCTDGLNSFQRKLKTETGISVEKVEVKEILDEVLNFKGYAGEFVQRRCRRAFDIFHKNDIMNTDDFAMGVIKI